jgi:hypothetical protein
MNAEAPASEPAPMTAAAPPPMTAAEAHAAAEQEGLTLVRATNPTGFKCVFHTGARANKPFQAKLNHGGSVIGNTVSTIHKAKIAVPEGRFGRSPPLLLSHNLLPLYCSFACAPIVFQGRKTHRATTALSLRAKLLCSLQESPPRCCAASPGAATGRAETPGCTRGR